MDPDPRFERLQRALLPDYRLEYELASGGMGRVFRAHDVTLNCPVAVKVLRLELATAHAAEQFLREAHLLARVRHPHIVTIHHAGSGEGLHYYIMELVEGPTLEQRLAQGPLSPADAVKLGRDLLDGLETVHQAGIVHRDVKPSNVFLVGDPPRALLADFGIARGRSTSRSTPGRSIVSGEGTPGYMAPEQISGGPITPQTDLYSAGVVLYEAVAGRRFPPLGEKPSWNGVPWSIARVLRRAVREDPAERWLDARQFRHALRRTRVMPYLVRGAILAVGGIVLGAALASIRIPVSPGRLIVAVPRFDYIGPAAQHPVADSLAELLRADLRSHPDFRVTASRGWFRRATPSLVIRGRVAIADGKLQVQLSNAAGTAMPELLAPVGEWSRLGDSLTYRILLAVWDSKSPLAASLPRGALPRTPLGLARFLEAEQFVAAGEWENAYRAYVLAEVTDSTCWLCSWRLYEVERWLSREHDPARVRRFLSHVDSFPDWYASLIRASQLPLAARLDTLERETRRWRDFFLGHLQLGDELFHRGPLAGHRRAEAIPAFETAATRSPHFSPAWEHLAWVLIDEGDSAGAARALAQLDRREMGNDRYALALRALLGVAFAFRFWPEPVALEHLHTVLESSGAGASADLAAGPRMLGAFDAPRGEIAFGQILAARPTRDLQRSGLVAQLMGSLALGRPTRARALVEQLHAISPESDVTLFATELDAVLALLDSAALGSATTAPRRVWPVGAVGGGPHERQLWLNKLLDRNRPALLAFISSRDVDSTARNIDPFFRTVARTLRAEQRERQGDIAGARRELVWFEHTDVVGLPTGLPQAAEVDWAFGTLARWRLARLLGANGYRAEACAAYRAVVRLWSEGEPVYRARADTAREQVQQLQCP